MSDHPSKPRTRDEMGRFLPGCRGGPGRLPRKKEEAYLTTLKKSVTLREWRLICARALSDAMDGDASARLWISRYLLPAPQVAVAIGVGVVNGSSAAPYGSYEAPQPLGGPSALTIDEPQDDGVFDVERDIAEMDAMIPDAPIATGA